MSMCTYYYKLLYRITSIYLLCFHNDQVILNSSMVDNVHGVVVQLHPVAAFSIVDSHERRPKESQSRVIGSLLGVVKEKGVYEVVAAVEFEKCVGIGQHCNVIDVELSSVW